MLLFRTGAFHKCLIMNEKIEKKISKAKSYIAINQPFLSGILYTMDIVYDDTMESCAATDGSKIFINPEKIDEYSVKEIVFILAHECMHCIMFHMMRMDDRDKLLWNIATDIVINRILIMDSVGEYREGWIDEPTLYDKGEGMSEKVYDLLLKMAKNNKKISTGQSEHSKPFDDLIPSNTNRSKKETEKLKQTLKEKVAYFATFAKNCGKLSKNIERAVGNILNPKISWKQILMQYMTKSTKENRSWNRPNRRFISQGLCVPSRNGVSMDKLVIAVDCSGSISNKELAEFSAEMKKIKEDVCPEETHVLYFDSDVRKHDVFTKDEELLIKPKGGGGTAFSPIFRHLGNDDLCPDCCVILTDLFCDDFGNCPDYPVIWVSTNKIKDVPFGEVVFMDKA